MPKALPDIPPTYHSTCKQTFVISLSVKLYLELLAFLAGLGVKGTVEPLGFRDVDIALLCSELETVLRLMKGCY